MDKMMDIKEIIKWFIPCFHILLNKSYKLNAHLTLVCLLLFFNLLAGIEAKKVNGSDLIISENVDESTKNLDLSVIKYDDDNSWMHNQSGDVDSRSFGDVFAGRTFGRPFKKMMAGLLPIVFQIGAASTWAVVAAVVGFKTLLVTLVILKLLLLAGAAKVGALFASKGHSHGHGAHGWEPPHQKEIHLHIHNGQHHEEAQIDHGGPYSGWSREGQTQIPEDSKNINVVVNPVNPLQGGPQTISTPYGNYVKIDSSLGLGATGNVIGTNIS